MNSQIPSAALVKERLEPLNSAALMAISTASGVPFTTLWKIRSGETTNPGIETIRKFFHLLADSEQNPAIPSVERSFTATDSVAPANHPAASVAA